MKLIQKTTGALFRGIRSIGTTLHVMAGGVSVRTEDIPLATHVGDSLSLRDVEAWIRQNLESREEPVKVALVREKHLTMWKVSCVVLNKKNKRLSDPDGRLRAYAQLVRAITPELEEFFGNHSTVLLRP